MKKTFTGKFLPLILALTLMLAAIPLAAYAETATASDFANAVTAIKNATTLEAKEAALENATDVLSAYKNGGGSESDAAIADAYDYYETAKADIEQRVGWCNEFVEAVSAALDVTAPYATIRENLDIAKALIDEEKVDMAYGSVSLHEEFRNDLEKNKLKEPEEVCQKFVDYAAKAAAAKTWKEADQYVTLANAAKMAMDKFDYPLELDGYEGVEEAKKQIEAAKEFMSAQVIAAKPFCEAVKNIGKAESVSIGILEAYEILEGIDATAENAAASLANLEKAKRSYNRSVKEANAAANEAAELLFSLLF